MATIEKRGDSWRVLVRRKGHKPISKTFRLKALADRYARQVEQGLDAQRVGAEDPTLDGVMESYIALKAKAHPSHLAHAERTREIFSKLRVSDLSGNTLIAEIERHGLGVSSAEKHLTILRAALRSHEVLSGFPLALGRFETAVKGLRKAGIVKPARARLRRVSDQEIAAIKGAVRYVLPFDDLIDISVLTCLRLGELLRISWADIDHAKKLILVRDRKHPTHKIGNDQWVPLLNGAYERLLALPRRGERIVPHHPKSIQNLWMAAVKKAGIEDCTWHDLRHEGISRLFEQGYGIAEVALVSGHRDWKALRIYVQLKPESLHAGPAGRDI